MQLPTASFSCKDGNISLLDCTLRDGGHVNNWKFGAESIQKIIKGLSKARVDIIELGLLREGPSDSGSTLQPSILSFVNLIPVNDVRASQYFTVMVRPDWFDASNIEPYSSHSLVKGIRFAFYPADAELTYRQACLAREKGYDVFLNAVGVSCYSPSKLASTLRMLNTAEPVAYSIVDTFGAFDIEDLEAYHDLFVHEANSTTAIGLHLHENKGLAFALAKHFMRIRNPSRDIIIDASLYGMGRVPGNLPIEQVIMHLIANGITHHPYQLAPVMQLIENQIYPIRNQFKWGYSPEYLVSAQLNVNRNYPEFFAQHQLPMHLMHAALSEVRIKQGGNFQFDQSLAEDILNSISQTSEAVQ